MKAARERKHSNEHADGTGDSENSDDGGNPAGPNASQIVNDGDGHGSNSPERVNHAQAHRRGCGKNPGKNPNGQGNSNSHNYCGTCQVEVRQETVGGISAHGE